MHVSVSHRPINTDMLIRQHDAAFRYVPLHPAAGGLIHDYQELPGHGSDEAEALFRPLSNNTKSGRGQAIMFNGIYKLVSAYSTELGFTVGAHSLLATAATNALDHLADIAKVQEWLGHANITTTRIYDHLKTRPEDSPRFKVNY
jgi:integrase/recombinase XerD